MVWARDWLRLVIRADIPGLEPSRESVDDQVVLSSREAGLSSSSRPKLYRASCPVFPAEEIKQAFGSQLIYYRSSLSVCACLPQGSQQRGGDDLRAVEGGGPVRYRALGQALQTGGPDGS